MGIAPLRVNPLRRSASGLHRHAVARVEAKVILAMVLRSFGVERRGAVATDPGISLRPLGGMLARIRVRR